MSIEGPLCFPFDGGLRQTIRTLLRCGERDLVLDLTGVSRIDANGVGELVRAYNMTIAANGHFQIVNANAWVRAILTRVHLFSLLSADPEQAFKAS